MASPEQSQPEKHPLRNLMVGFLAIIGGLALIDAIDINFVKD